VGAYGPGSQKAIDMVAQIWKPSTFHASCCDRAADVSARKGFAGCWCADSFSSHGLIFGFTSIGKHVLEFTLTLGQLICMTITFLAAAKDINSAVHEIFLHHKKQATEWLPAATASDWITMLIRMFIRSEEQRQQALD